MSIFSRRVLYFVCLLAYGSSFAAKDSDSWSIDRHLQIAQAYENMTLSVSDPEARRKIRDAGEKHILRARARAFDVEVEPFSKPDSNWTMTEYVKIVQSYAEKSRLADD
jgi:hypothetical protein